MRKSVNFRAFLFISLVEVELGFAFWWWRTYKLQELRFVLLLFYSYFFGFEKQKKVEKVGSGRN